MSSERLLIIEDEARIAQFVERALIYEGYRVSVARDGQTGLQIARDEKKGTALSVLSVDAAVPAELIERLGDAIGAAMLRTVDIIDA